MIKIRPKCPVCGTRLNEGAIDREVELGNGDDIIEQDIGGRGNVSTIDSYDYDEEHAEAFLEKVNHASEYLEETLGIEEKPED